MGYPSGWFRSAVLVRSPPWLLPTHSILALGVLERALMLCQHCSAIDKTLVQYQCCSSYKSRAQHCMGCCGERELHPSQTPVQGADRHKCHHAWEVQRKSPEIFQDLLVALSASPWDYNKIETSLCIRNMSLPLCISCLKRAAISPLS